jgi:hypothetical protein
MSRYQWTCVTELAPFAARDGAGLLSFNGRMWLLGGWNPDDKIHFPRICNSEVWSSADGCRWTLECPQAPWEGRHTAGCVVHEGRMWIVGGDCNQKHYQDDVWSSSDGRNWSCVSANVPWAPRALHHTVVHDGFIWVLGGQTMPGMAPGFDDCFHRDVWRSRDGAAWEKVLDPAPWQPRGMIGGSAIHRGRLWLLGGGTYSTPQTPSRQFLNDAWSTADGREWRCHQAACPWHPRQYHEVAAFDDQLWVLEGWDGRGNRADVWHSPDGVNWQELPGTPWAPRHAASVVVHQGALWVVAGNNMTPDVWRLDRASA